MKSKIFRMIGSLTFLFLLSINTADATALFNEEGFDTLEEALVDAFGKNYENYLNDNRYEYNVAQKVEELIKEKYSEEYPPYYGGMYISNDSKNLIIQIVEKNIPKKNTVDYMIYESLISLDNSIIIEIVDNSYNELNDLMGLINSNANKFDKNFNYMALDVIDNHIVVELLDNTINKQKEFEEKTLNINSCSLYYKTITNELDYSKLISYKQGEKRISKANNLKPGAAISTQVGTCSVGFRTKYNGKAGYVTAGHCARVDGTETTLATGQVRLFQFENNKKYDYAFVETNSKYSPSNTLAYKKDNLTFWEMELLVVKNASIAMPVGTAIAKVGATTKYTSGKITHLNISEYRSDSGTTILGLVDSDMPSSPGDSGGAIFIPQSNTTATPIGILSGGKSNTTTFTSINDFPLALKNGRY